MTADLNRYDNSNSNSIPRPNLHDSDGGCCEISLKTSKESMKPQKIGWIVPFRFYSKNTVTVSYGIIEGIVTTISPSLSGSTMKFGDMFFVLISVIL